MQVEEKGQPSKIKQPKGKKKPADDTSVASNKVIT
jgi:hypothetical protein